MAGQSKFMKFAENRCTKRAKRYLQLKYEYFVGLITTKPENDNCKSVFARTENVQCNEIIEQMYWKTTDLNEMDSKMAYESSKECQQAEVSALDLDFPENIRTFSEMHDRRHVPFRRCHKGVELV